jgi:trans-2,3-dihydro-3-hydroxyanthranilate isomerase
MTHEYVIADAFTDRPLEGNPVAVFLGAGDLDGGTMQRVARETNLSESVFILDRPAAGEAQIRIFTPSLELPFAGHPVLGTAFVIADGTDLELVTLHCPAGPVPVALTRDGDGELVHGEMEQPLPTPEAPPDVSELLAALGVEADETALPIAAYRNGAVHVYVPLADPRRISELRPDHGRLEALGAFGVSTFALEAGHVHTRMFGIGVGVTEDPATGSAAGPLALYLAEHGRIAYGERIEIRQGAEIGRPSRLLAQVDGAPGHVERVLVGGGAVIVARGVFRLN